MQTYPNRCLGIIKCLINFIFYAHNNYLSYLIPKSFIVVLQCCHGKRNSCIN